MSESPLRALGSSGGKDEVDRPIVALKFKLAKHQRTVGVAARLPRQREGMEDKVGANDDLVVLESLGSLQSCVQRFFALIAREKKIKISNIRR